MSRNAHIQESQPRQYKGRKREKVIWGLWMVGSEEEIAIGFKTGQSIRRTFTIHYMNM